MTSLFDKYIGIDYSGAGEPYKANKGIAVAIAERDKLNAAILMNSNSARTIFDKLRLPLSNEASWSRKDIYLYLRNEFATSKQRIIVGIDHGFSYPEAVMQSLNLQTWDEFLKWFNTNWKTAKHSVEFCKQRMPYISSTARRLVEREFVTTAKGVLDLDRAQGRQGAVSYSTHAGLAWIYRLRRLQKRSLLNIHFWPYDGPVVDDNAHVIFEGYPALYKKRVSAPEELNEHERDAFYIASWLRDRDHVNTLQQYLMLSTLCHKELKLTKLEGWVLGCL